MNRTIPAALFTIFSVLFVGVYLTSCLTPYISPARFWPLTFLALGFPLLACCMLLLTLVWLVVNRKIGVLLFIIFLCGFKSITAVFAFRIQSAFKFEKDTSAVRLLDWNVKHFVSSDKRDESPTGGRRGIINFMRKVNADIVLFQEFEETRIDEHYSNIKMLVDTLGYKYYYLSKELPPKDLKEPFALRVAIFSKIPLSNPQRFSLNNPEFEESMVTADVVLNGKKMRLVTFHLVSLELGQPDDNSQFFGRVNRSFFRRTSRMHKLKYYDSIHGRQAIFIKSILDKSPFPLIVSGDFNAVPGSFAYQKIKGDLQDAFLAKGAGFGRTFSGLSPTLRIDFLLLAKQLQVQQYYSPRLYLSDHFPVVADVK